MATDPDNPAPGPSEPSPDLPEKVDDALEALWDGEADELDRLVESEGSAGSPGVSEAVGEMMRRVDEDTREAVVPQRIGDYAIKRVLGRGGMGTVYLAVQEHPRRTVALKVLKAGIASRSALRRFEYEAQILARLKHPNIAQVYEAGTHGEGEESVPYFALEYVPNARPITEYARLKKLSTRQRLELFTKVCDAIHHGHQKGIIHRDLKPGNILVDSNGEVKIIDFGVARSTDSDMAVTTLQTDIGQLIGTLQYMSPEQCEADPHDLDVRSDVYALGVVLYELLCEQLPYDVTKVAVYEAMKLIREGTPARPSTLNRMLRGDIETIALKALEKERERRYGSAADLGDDIRRYLTSEPIQARPPSVVYQVKMFARRNRAVFAAGMMVFAVLAAATVVSLLFALAANQARHTAESEAQHRLTAEREALAARDEEARQHRAAEAAREEAQGNLALAEEREKEAERQKEIAQAVNDFLTEDLLAAVAPSTKAGRGKDVLMRDVLDVASEKIEEASQSGRRFTDKPLIEASIRATLGVTYRLLGEYPNAEPHLERARQLRERELGEEHPDTLKSMGNLAILCHEQGRYDEAEPLYVKTLEISKRVLGEEHPHTLSSMNNLAGLYLDQGRDENAESLYVKTLEMRRLILGEEHPDTLRSMNSLVGLYFLQGRYDEAEPLYVETLEIQKRILGEEHPDTLNSMNGLAVLYWKQGRYDEAESLYVKTLEIQKRVLGEEHPDTLASLNNLAILYNDQGRYDEAEPLYVQTLEISKRVLGEEHPDTLFSMANLAVLYWKQGRYDEAEPLSVQTLEIQKRVLGEEHPDTLGSMGNLAILYDAQGRHDQAEQLQVRALEIQKRVLGEEDPSTLFSMANLAESYHDQHRFHDAVALIEPAVAGARRVFGERHWLTGAFIGVYGRTLAALQRLEDAEAALMEAYEILMGSVGPDNDYTKNAVESFIDLYTAWHEAEPDKGYDARAEEWRAKLPHTGEEQPPDRE